MEGLNAEDAKTILEYLDTVAIRGHQERNKMNKIFAKLLALQNTRPTGDTD